MKSPPSTISSQDLVATLSPEMVTLYESLNARAEFYEAQSLTSERFWSPRPLPWQIIEPIVNAIEKVPEVFAITKLHQLSPGSSTGYPIHTTLLASGLVRRTHDLGDGLTAITELLTLIQTNITKGRLTLVLAGLQVEKSVEIATGIILCPFKDVRPPPWYKDLEDKSHWPLSQALDPVEPSSVLITKTDFISTFTRTEHGPNRYPEENVKNLKNISNCIAIAVGNPIPKLPIWCEDNDPRLPLQSSGIILNDWTSPGMAASCWADVNQIQTIIADYEHFQGDRGPLEMSMTRLVSAWEGRDREARAIDLGIALESMLMFEVDAKKREPSTEIRYKLGLRAAWLVGEKLAGREHAFRLTRKLYDFRSEAAHIGHIRVTSKNWQTVDEKINEGITFTRNIILNILSHRKWPNWNLLVLGGDYT